MQGIKSYYETIIQQARIQFFSNGTLTNEWIANKDSGIPEISVPLSPGTTIYRNIWKQALKNIQSWVTGVSLSGIIFPVTKVLQNFDHNVNKIDNIITYDYIVDDINNVSFIIRELSYDRGTDQITLAPRITTSTIYWVDYLNQLTTLIEYERIIDNFYRNAYGI